ncbi:MAG: hypothetical protein OXG85_15150 [Chloroflexi bacterium]|nr:hypothetical protein [Chloroflexota bacterium]
MRLSICSLLLVLMLPTGLASTVAAQDAPPKLILTETQIGAQPDGFGGERPVVRGEVFNHGTEAYRNISIAVEAYDGSDALIGEGFGFLVDACGTALLDYALMPGEVQGFSAPYEVFDSGVVANVRVRVAAEAVAADWPPQTEAPAAQMIARDEVVMLEWLDDETLLFGVGCDDAVFTELAWFRYDLPDHALSEIEHPDAAKVTAEMIERSDAAMVTQSGEQNPALFYGSRMTFPPGARRIVYQNDLHTIFSAEPDGSFKRLIHDKLHQHSLRGFIWARQEGVFLAYYFGSYGEPVHFFTADVEGRMLMGRLEELAPSLIVPGPVDDGLAAVVGWRRGDVSGYYLTYAFGGSELLFEAELPGNNYPAPIVAGDLVYVIRPIEGVATLQCFNRRTRELNTISALPLHLSPDARAWAWLSPGGEQLAVAMNGTEGGLWWVDGAGGCG